MSGGWTDGGGNWYCPNGQSYTLGLCSGVGGYNGGDPLPSALHASIIADIAGTFYPTAGSILVPPGVVDGQVVFQMNDASLADNFGNIAFCVKVSNPATVVNITGIAGGTASPAVLSRATMNIGDVVYVTPQLSGSSGRYDGGFSADQNGTWKVVSVTNYTGGTACDWQWQHSNC